MKNLSKKVAICLLGVVLLTSCGGPSENVIKGAIEYGFQSPGSMEGVSLGDLEKRECELTNNDKASRDIKELWLVEFTPEDAEGNQGRRERMFIERTNDNIWRPVIFQFNC